MAVISVGIPELKTRLGMYMDRVRGGATIIITDRGQPAGHIIPIQPSPHARIQELVQASSVAWSGRKPARRAPLAHVRVGRAVADLLGEERE